MDSSSSNTTSFPCFSRLPWELRTCIWELTISPRTVHIHVKHRTKRDGRERWGWPVKAKLIFTSSSIPGALHACQEDRNHLTHPACSAGSGGLGHYEKMTSSDLLNAQRPWNWEEECPTPVPYIWVNFEVDMIDIGYNRYKLGTPYASNIRRVKYIAVRLYKVFDEVLMPGEHGFPCVKEAEVECYFEMDDLGEVLACVSMAKLVCKMEDILCQDRTGKRMTLAKVAEEYLQGRPTGYLLRM